MKSISAATTAIGYDYWSHLRLKFLRSQCQGAILPNPFLNQSNDLKYISDWNTSAKNAVLAVCQCQWHPIRFLRSIANTLLKQDKTCVIFFYVLFYQQKCVCRIFPPFVKKTTWPLAACVEWVSPCGLMLCRPTVSGFQFSSAKLS